MSLREYERKRNRKKTPEPFSGKRKGKAPIFVVQRHDARRLHYDFRLERDGALASWAVPKGVPLEPGQQHLAVHVEDHPLDYATFEGEIPKGNYGAGSVEIWDNGTYELLEEKSNGGLTVRLHGKKLDGVWALVPAHLSGDPKNWLILRKRDEGTASARRDYAPMLATLDDPKSIPRQGYEFEIKWDGYRIVSRVSGGEARLLSRKDQDYTERFANVAKELEKALKTPDAVVDGEVVALDEEGRPSFSAMQQGLDATVKHSYDVGGPDAVSMIELLDAIARAMGRPRGPLKAHIPLGVVRPLTRALYRLPGFPLTPDQLLMLEEDNTCDPSAFFSTFGLTPVPLAAGLRAMLG